MLDICKIRVLDCIFMDIYVKLNLKIEIKMNLVKMLFAALFTK